MKRVLCTFAAASMLTATQSGLSPAATMHASVGESGLPPAATTLNSGLKPAGTKGSSHGTTGTTQALTKIQSDAASGITEYRLNSNGLQVLLAQRHHTPIVTVMVVYHVGSRNEAVGYTGSTHFLEHMMFRGTARHDPLKGTGIDDILKPIGGINNATTYYDRTNYYEIVPAQYLGVCLDLEADRMRGALLREADHKSEMTVVRNELERDEDDPVRLMEVNTFAQAYQAHPYHHPVIGWRSDVENVPIARLRKFYNDFYYPNNATLVVAGDFQTPQALDLVAKYFGHVPAAPAPFPPVYTKEPPQQGERRFVVTRGEDLPKVGIGFHIPAARSKDTYALEVISSILGDEKKQSSRLYKALIDTNMASDCYAYNYSLHDPGMFSLLSTATPDTPSEKIETALYDQTQKLAHEPVTDAELDKAKKSVWKRMKLDAADPAGMSSQLAEAIAVADWKWWVGFEDNIRAVTKADVQQAAARYFNKRNETVGYYYPTHKPTEKSAPSSESSPGVQQLLDVPAYTVAPATTAGEHENYTPSSQPSAQPAATEPGHTQTAAPSKSDVETTPTVQTKPNAAGAGHREPKSVEHKASMVFAVGLHASIASQVRKKVFPNGLTLLVMPVPGSGVVSVSGKIRAGDYFHPELRNVPDFVADMLDKGSAHWSKEQLANQLELMGTTLDFESENFFADWQSDVVGEDVPQYLSILSDVLQHPVFSAEELEKSKKQTIAAVQAATSDTTQVATNAFYSKVYKPDCVYYQDKFPQQITDAQKVSIDQLKAFHQAQYTPANTVLAIVGDIDVDTAFSLVGKEFGDWKGGAASTIDVGACHPAAAGIRIDNPLADKTNVEVIMGQPAPLDIRSSDFYAASLANAALGHDTVSSRLAELRNKYGLTYGISSYFSENAYANAPWVIDFTVNPENLAKSMPIVNEILAKYRHGGITKEELENESNRLAGEYIVERMRTPKQLADALTKYEILGLGAKFMDDYPKKLKTVTVEEVNKAIDKYFDPKKFVTSVAGTIPGK